MKCLQQTVLSELGDEASNHHLVVLYFERRRYETLPDLNCMVNLDVHHSTDRSSRKLVRALL